MVIIADGGTLHNPKCRKMFQFVMTAYKKREDFIDQIEETPYKDRTGFLFLYLIFCHAEPSYVFRGPGYSYAYEDS